MCKIVVFLLMLVFIYEPKLLASGSFSDMHRTAVISVEPDTIIGPPPDISDCFIDSIYVSGIESSQPMFCWQVYLTRNSAVLGFVESTEGPFLQSGGQTMFFCTSDYPDSHLVLGCTLIGGGGAVGSGTVCYITWEVRGYGSSVLGINNSNTYILDTMIDEIPCTKLNGYFNLPPVGLDEISSPQYEMRLESYPNPFTQLTNISYQLPVEGKTSLRIYNISGRLVKTLVNSKQKPGYYRIDWAPNNLLASIYFLRLESQAKVITEKIVMLR